MYSNVSKVRIRYSAISITVSSLVYYHDYTCTVHTVHKLADSCTVVHLSSAVAIILRKSSYCICAQNLSCNYSTASASTTHNLLLNLQPNLSKIPLFCSEYQISRLQLRLSHNVTLWVYSYSTKVYSTVPYSSLQYLQTDLVSKLRNILIVFWIDL